VVREMLSGKEAMGDFPNSGRKELQSSHALLRSEQERLNILFNDLEEKHEAAELQMKQQSANYRTQLQQREAEISHLTASQTAPESDAETEVSMLQEWYRNYD
jgi:hypothetical protein